MVGRSQWDIEELNKGARFNGYKNWSDPALKADKNAVSRILKQLALKNGIWQPPLTVAERVAIASQAQVKHTWASVIKEFPDFEKGMKEYLDTKTQKPELKKINKLKISSEKKFNMMTGRQKQFLLKYNLYQFQPFKNSITVPEMGKLSKFKSVREVLTPISAESYNYKNGVKVLDSKFYVANRAQLFQDYLKREGMERLAIPAHGAEGIRFKGRWILTDKAIKEGKTFASIIGAYPNLKGKPTTIYNNILSNVTKDHPIYKDTQQGLRSLFNFVKKSINLELRELKPAALRTLVENNPTLLKQVTGYVDPVSKTINYQGVAGLKNLSTEEILNRARLVTEHNRPMRDYASKYMDKDRLRVLAKNLRNIDADMTHNISLASQWYNNSLKETATNLAEANKNNPKVLEHLSNEFKKMNQRMYVGGKFYGAEVATSPKYTKSIVDFWRGNLKGVGLEHLWDKYAGQYNKRGFGTIDDILNKTLKDRTSLRQIGTFFGCPTTFKSYDEGGRVRLQTGGQGLAQCVDTKLKQPGAMEKLAALPEEVSGTLGRLKNAATNFLKLLGRGGVKAAPYAAITAGGAAAAGLVKTFMNDDPSTYLSDENQQKNMLIDMITSPLDDTPQESPDILDWQLPVLGAETALGTAVTAPSTIEAARSARFGKTPSGITKTALKSLGRGLMTTGTPLGLAALEPLHIAGQIQQGDSPVDIATNPWNYLGPAFMPSMTKAATKGLGAASNVAKVMRLGLPMAAVNAWNPIGWGLLAGSVGIEGYKQYQDYKNKRGWFSDE